VRIKFMRMVNGIAVDDFLDSSKNWIAVRFTQAELTYLATFNASQVMLTAPLDALRSNPHAVATWAEQWPTQFYGGSHKPPAGGLILPNGCTVDQDKGS
jgi:hypothetical protein